MKSSVLHQSLTICFIKNFFLLFLLLLLMQLSCFFWRPFDPVLGGGHTHHLLTIGHRTLSESSPSPPPLFSPHLRRIENDWKQFPRWTISGARSVLDFHFSCLFVLTLAFLPLFQRHHLYHFCSNTSSETVALTPSPPPPPLPCPIVFIRT